MHNYENIFLQYYGSLLTKNCAVINRQPTKVYIVTIVLCYGMALRTVYIQPHLLHSYMHWNKAH